MGGTRTSTCSTSAPGYLNIPIWHHIVYPGASELVCQSFNNYALRQSYSNHLTRLTHRIRTVIVIQLHVEKRIIWAKWTNRTDNFSSPSHKDFNAFIVKFWYFYLFRFLIMLMVSSWCFLRGERTYFTDDVQTKHVMFVWALLPL